MTQPRRNVATTTEFSDWLRSAPELDSSQKLATTDIDFHWVDWSVKPNRFMWLETKEYRGKLTEFQKFQFAMLDDYLSKQNNYYGFHLIHCPSGTPDKGLIILDGYQITRGELITFLKFQAPPVWYGRRAWKKYIASK